MIHIVGDHYDFSEAESLKGDERRGNKKGQEFGPSSNLEIPEWRELMGNPQNKAILLKYVYETMKDHHEDMIPDDVVFVLGGTFRERGKTLLLKRRDKKLLHDLSCAEHEEADTRIIAHMVYNANNFGHQNFVIHATDTDIIMLCIYHLAMNENIARIWIQKKDTYLPVHILLEKLAGKYC